MIAIPGEIFGLLLLVGCSEKRPDYFYPYGFGDVCTTDADCVQDYHCSAPQGGRCTWYCGCDSGEGPTGCRECPSRCGGGFLDGCEGVCSEETGECLVSY